MAEKLGPREVLLLLAILVLAFVGGLLLLRGDSGHNVWWHYFVAVPIGLLLLASKVDFTRDLMVKWLSVPVGIALTIWLLKSGYYGRICGLGVVYIVLGVVFLFYGAEVEGSGEDHTWVLAAFAAVLLGMLILVTGIVVGICSVLSI